MAKWHLNFGSLSIIVHINQPLATEPVIVCGCVIFGFELLFTDNPPVQLGNYNESTALVDAARRGFAYRGVRLAVACF